MLWDVGHDVTPAAEHGVNPRPPGAGRWGKGEGCAGTTRSARGAGSPAHRTISHPAFVTPLPSSGVGAGGSQLKGWRNENAKGEEQPLQWEGAKGYFRATKDGNPGAARGPMNGNQQTAPAAAADGDRLSPPTNRVREGAPAPSPGRGGASPRGLLNLVSASPPSAARGPAPAPRLRAPAPRRPSPPLPGSGAGFGAG